MGYVIVLVHNRFCNNVPIGRKQWESLGQKSIYIFPGKQKSLCGGCSNNAKQCPQAWLPLCFAWCLSTSESLALLA